MGRKKKTQDEKAVQIVIFLPSELGQTLETFLEATGVKRSAALRYFLQKGVETALTNSTNTNVPVALDIVATEKHSASATVEVMKKMLSK